LLLKRQLVEKEGVTQPYGNAIRLKLPSPDGKMRETEVVNMAAVFRIVQSIPSKNAAI
jgi:hypothetical protein